MEYKHLVNLAIKHENEQEEARNEYLKLFDKRVPVAFVANIHQNPNVAQKDSYDINLSTTSLNMN